MEEINNASPPCKLDHISIAVENLETAIDLYVELLGLTVVERRQTRGRKTGMISAVLTGAGLPIVLVQGIEPESQVTQFVKTYGAGVQHIAFAVDDMDESMADFEKAGIGPAFHTIEGQGIRQCFLAKTQSGPRLELIERSGGSFNDASIKELFEAMEERDLI